jgi:hypothetical protein
MRPYLAFEGSSGPEVYFCPGGKCLNDSATLFYRANKSDCYVCPLKLR